MLYSVMKLPPYSNLGQHFSNLDFNLDIYNFYEYNIDMIQEDVVFFFFKYNKCHQTQVMDLTQPYKTSLNQLVRVAITFKL